jgi:hypothetical protein
MKTTNSTSSPALLARPKVAQLNLKTFVATALVVATATGTRSFADNPVVQTSFTADPAPMVYSNTVYLYTSHDEDDARGFHMLDWKCYSTTDMVNWTDHGSIASLATFPWAAQNNGASAPQCIERDGKFYLYVPITVPGWPNNVIAVAVSDSPLITKRDGNEILPIIYDDNYITVFPGETAEIHGTIWKGGKLRWVKLEGYNTPAISVPIK